MRGTLRNQKGFTLIELMIVIAIIGILAAIAIPNFINYRNKSFCSGAESDANLIAAAVADYFAVPAHTAITKATLTGVRTLLSNNNTWGLTPAAGLTSITITVQDASGRCPADYQTPMNATANPTGYWDGSNGYTKIMSN